MPPPANGGVVASGVGCFAGAPAFATRAGFGVTAGRPTSATVGVTARAVAVALAAVPVPRERFAGGSTTHENGISEIAGRFSVGTNGVAVAEDTKRLTNGGGIGGQLPSEVAGGVAAAGESGRRGGV